MTLTEARRARDLALDRWNRSQQQASRDWDAYYRLATRIREVENGTIGNLPAHKENPA